MEPEEESRWRWEPIATCWIVGMLILVPVVLAAMGVAPDPDDVFPTLLVGLLTFHGMSVAIILTVVWLRVPAGERLDAMALRMPERPIRDTILAMVSILPCVMLIGLTFHLLEVEIEPAPYVDWIRRGTTTEVLFLVFAAGVVAPISEELMFRLTLNGTIEPYLGRIAAILLTSAIFAVCHGIPTQVPVLAVVAIVLHSLRFMRDSVLSAILAHACYNNTVLLLMLIALRWQ